MGSFLTSFGKRRNVRVSKKMNKRTLKKIWVCNDLWMDIFPFFGHAQLGLKLALLSPRFDSLVDTHFDGKSEFTIWRWITIYKMGTEAKLSVDGNCLPRAFPLPDRPLPNKIRFDYLRIEYIDHSVLAFLRSNKQIFDGKGNGLDFYVCSSQTDDEQLLWNIFVREIWPIFAPNIRYFRFAESGQLNYLLRQISPTILTDLNQLNSIHSFRLLPDVIGDFNGPNATAGQILSKWLHTPTKDGQPKHLRCVRCVVYCESRLNKWINNFKEAFLRATTSSIHILSLDLSKSAQFVPFELVNERTREKLTLEKGQYYWLLKRCAIGQTVQWENKKKNLNNVFIPLSDVNCIGPLSPPTAGQMNAKCHLKMKTRAQRKKK